MSRLRFHGQLQRFFGRTTHSLPQLLPTFRARAPPLLTLARPLRFPTAEIQPHQALSLRLIHQVILLAAHASETTDCLLYLPSHVFRQRRNGELLEATYNNHFRLRRGVLLQVLSRQLLSLALEVEMVLASRPRKIELMGGIPWMTLSTGTT